MRLSLWLFSFLSSGFFLQSGVCAFTSPSSTTRSPFQVFAHEASSRKRCSVARRNQPSQPLFTTASTTTDSKDDDDALFVEAQDGEGLQALFSKQCDNDGLMTIGILKKVPAIAEMLQDGDLLEEELVDIWDAAPKFPEEAEHERIDVDSFIQIYRDIDDMFEDEDSDEEESGSLPVLKEKQEKPKKNNNVGKMASEANGKEEPKVAADADEDDDEPDDVVARDEEELEQLFKSLSDDNGLMTKADLRKWDEIEKLLEDGLLGDDEFDDLWTKTAKSPGSSDQLDVEGFLSFNVALDELFVFDDDEDDGDGMEIVAVDDEASSSLPSKPVVTDDDLPPGVLFAELANEEQLVGMDELKRWGDLQDMLAEGELLPLEFQNIYNGIAKAKNEMLNEEGFLALYAVIDDLFETDDGDGGDKSQEQTLPPTEDSDGAIKAQLVSFLDDMNRDTKRLPCGLESSELEEKQVLTILRALETEPVNRIKLTGGAIEQTELSGDWELLYASSSAFKFNKGLSGLGGSFPNGRFGGLVQKLQANKYVTDMEYIERIEVNPETASFDVRVNGDWSLRGSVSLFTGEPSLIMTVTPDRVMYGPTSTRADHWKSLGPLNQLDMTYLDDDLRIMRGSTSTDTVFVFRRTQ